MFIESSSFNKVYYGMFGSVDLPIVDDVMLTVFESCKLTILVLVLILRSFLFN